MAKVYSAYIGHFDSYKEANDYKKKHLKDSNYSIVTCEKQYSLKVACSVKENVIKDIAERLRSRFDIWIDCKEI